MDGEGGLEFSLGVATKPKLVFQEQEPIVSMRFTDLVGKTSAQSY